MSMGGMAWKKPGICWSGPEFPKRIVVAVKQASPSAGREIAKGRCRSRRYLGRQADAFADTGDHAKAWGYVLSTGDVDGVDRRVNGKVLAVLFAPKIVGLRRR